MRGTFAAARQAQLVVVNRPVTDGGDIEALADCALLIVDIDPKRQDHLLALQPITARLGGRAPVIVLTDAFDAAVGRWLVQLKVADFLCKPIKPDELLRAAVTLLSARHDTARDEAQITTILGAAGGVGATTIAVETAMQLTRRGGDSQPTCLVDLDFSSDACAEFLDLEPRLDLAAIGLRGERLDLQLLEAFSARHKSGLALVACPARAAEVLDVDAESIARLLDVIAMRYDQVVIDLPRVWQPWTDAVLAGSDRIFIVADMTVPGLRCARRILDRIAGRLAGRIEPKVIVNRFTKLSAFSNGLRVGDVEKALGPAYAGYITSNYGLVREAIDRGMPLEELRPGNIVSSDLGHILFPQAPDATLASRVVQFLSRF